MEFDKETDVFCVLEFRENSAGGYAQYRSDYSETDYTFEFPPSFAYKTGTGEFLKPMKPLKYGKKADIPDDCTYVKSIPQSVEELYSKHKNGACLKEEPLFKATASYFQAFADSEFKELKHQRRRIHITLMILDSWAINKDLLKNVLDPIFRQAGLLHKNPRAIRNLIYISELETRFLDNQFLRDLRMISAVTEMRRAFFHFDVRPGNYFDCKMTYFNFKEDPSFSTEKNKYFRPIITSTKFIPKALHFNIPVIAKRFADSVLKELKIDPDLIFLHDDINLTEATHWDYDSSPVKEFNKALQMKILKTSVEFLNESQQLSDKEFDDVFFLYKELTKSCFQGKGTQLPLDGLQKLLDRNLRASFSAEIKHLKSFINKHTHGRIDDFDEDNTFDDEQEVVYVDLDIDYLRENVYWTNVSPVRWFGRSLESSIKTARKKCSLNLYSIKHFLKRAYMSTTLISSPVVLEKGVGMNILGFTSQDCKEGHTYNKTPEYIIHIDMSSMELTRIKCDQIDDTGFIKSSMDLEIEINRLLSIQKYLESVTKLVSENNTTETVEIDTRIKKVKRELTVPLFKTYLTQLIRYSHKMLEQKDIYPNQAGVVLCLEKAIMKKLDVESRYELSANINDVAESFGPFKKIIITDQGDEEVWNIYQERPLDVSTYYIHPHIADDYIYIKLYQVMDVTMPGDTEGIKTAVYIEDRYMDIKNLYDQAGELFWKYVKALNNIKINEDEYETIKSNFIWFLKKKTMLCNSPDLCSKEHSITLCGDKTIQLTTQQILDNIIIPVVEQVSDSVASGVSEGFFDYYQVKKVIVTGSVMTLETSDNIYNDVIKKKMGEKFEEMFPEYPPELDFGMSNKSQSAEEKRIHYCYGRFLEGEPLVVSNTTLFVYRSKVPLKIDPQSFENLGSDYSNNTSKYKDFFHAIDEGSRLFSYGFLDCIIDQGQPFSRKEFKMLVTPVTYEGEYKEYDTDTYFVLTFTDEVSMQDVTSAIHIFGINEPDVRFEDVDVSAMTDGSFQVNFLKYNNSISVKAHFIKDSKPCTASIETKEDLTIKYF